MVIAELACLFGLIDEIFGSRSKVSLGAREASRDGAAGSSPGKT
jgi:hypothetical protein